MSLASLFPNRNSQKYKKSESSVKESNISAIMPSVDSDIIAVVNELIDAVSKDKIDNLRQTDEIDGNLALNADVSDFVEVAESELVVEHCESLKDNVSKRFLKQQGNMKKKETRSVSVNASEIESQTRSIRRKFGSEGEVLSICEKVLPPKQEKELNEAIEKYIEKLIKDSICKTLESVDVEAIRNDLMNKISNGKSKDHESEEEFIAEQRLSSNSISELVELRCAEYNGNDGHKDSLHSDSDEKLSEIEITDYDESDQISFGGYLADLDDAASNDDLKSTEGDSLNSSSCSGLRETAESETGIDDTSRTLSQNVDISESSEDSVVNEVSASNEKIAIVENTSEGNKQNQVLKDGTGNYMPQEEQNSELKEDHRAGEKGNEVSSDIPPDKNVFKQEQNELSKENASQQVRKQSSEEDNEDSEKLQTAIDSTNEQDQKFYSDANSNATGDLILMSAEDTSLLQNQEKIIQEVKVTPLDVDESLPCQKASDDDERLKVKWKVGNLHVKLPHKTRGKAHLKAWKKRRVVIQPDEFVNDPKKPSLIINVYGSDSKKHETTFWYSLSSQKAVLFRSSSRTHKYAFTISEGSQAIIHLSAENETITQEWMAAIRAVLWPPSPFMELEKMMSGREFDVSIVDNEFSYHAGLLGMYGFLTITPKKLILLHPQQGYVIQEWYLNTVDKFKFVAQPKPEDMHKVICMTTCRDSSTGQGEIIFFCNEAVTLLQSLASSIHEVLSYHSKQEGGRYKKELEEMAEWLVVPPQDCLTVENDEHYKVPPRQVKSLLDIPNFIFNKSLSPVTSAIYPAPNSQIMEPLDGKKNQQTTTSNDSGISNCTSGDDFLNCSVASFIIGGGPMTGKSSDSELSDTYTPPRTPEPKKRVQCKVVKEEIAITEE